MFKVFWKGTDSLSGRHERLSDARFSPGEPGRGEGKNVENVYLKMCLDDERDVWRGEIWGSGEDPSAVRDGSCRHKSVFYMPLVVLGWNILASHAVVTR